MPTSPAGSSKRNDASGLRSRSPSNQERLGSHAFIRSRLPGVIVASCKMAMGST